MVQWIAGLWSLIPVSRSSPGGGNGNPLQLFSHRKSHGQRSQPRYSLWGHKELNLTEHAHTHLHKSDLTDTYQVLHQKKKKLNKGNSLAVRTQCFHYCGLGSILSQGTKIPQATKCGNTHTEILFKHTQNISRIGPKLRYRKSLVHF